MKDGTQLPSAAETEPADESGKVRTTISLPPDIMRAGLKRKTERRAASFSNLVEILIAEDVAKAASGEAVAA